MRTFVILLLGLFLLVPLGQGQTEERASTDAIESLAGDRGPGQSPGQCCWSRPAELITGDIRCLGVEFDDGPNGSNHYWVTGAYDFTVAHLYKIDQFGTLLAVQRGDGGLCFLITAHLDKTKTLAPTGVPIHDNLGAVHGTMLAEKLLQHGISNFVAKITNIQILTHNNLQVRVADL